MSLSPYATPLELHIRCSSFLRYSHLAAHLLPAALPWMIEMPLWAIVSIMLSSSLAWWWNQRNEPALGGPEEIWRWGGDQRWRCDGDDSRIWLLEQTTFRSPLLCVLYFRTDAPGSFVAHRARLVSSDSVGAEVFRRLRVRLALHALHGESE